MKIWSIFTMDLSQNIASGGKKLLKRKQNFQCKHRKIFVMKVLFMTLNWYWELVNFVSHNWFSSCSCSDLLNFTNSKILAVMLKCTQQFYSTVYIAVSVSILLPYPRWIESECYEIAVTRSRNVFMTRIINAYKQNKMKFISFIILNFHLLLLLSEISSCFLFSYYTTNSSSQTNVLYCWNHIS